MNEYLTAHRTDHQKRHVQTCVKSMRLRSKIDNFLTDYDLRMCKNWPILLRFTQSV